MNGTAYAKDRNRISQGGHRGQTDADGFLDWTRGHLAPGRRGRTVFVEQLLGFRGPRNRCGFGVGASYTAVDPWYDSYYADPCWDYAYYELYWYECPLQYQRIHSRLTYSDVSVQLYRYPRRPSYYRPYSYYGYLNRYLNRYPNRYPSHSHFSIGFSVNFGFGYRTGYYGYQPVYYGYNRYRPYYPTYGYPA